MFVIPRDSEAFRVLESMVNDPKVYAIAIASNVTQVSLKANQGTWTPPMTVEATS